MRNKKEPPLIAHVIFSLGVGGLENGVINLINNLPADKYRHAIICIKNSTDFSLRIQRDNVDIYELNKIKWTPLSRQIIREFKIEPS